MTFAFDTETGLIGPGLLAPPMVCLSSAVPKLSASGAYERADGDLFHVRDLTPYDIEVLLQQPIIAGANLAYDMTELCLTWPELVPLVFKAYDEDRCRDVSLDQKLIDNANGELGGYKDHNDRFHEYKYGLADLEQRWFNRDRSASKKGPDVWRLRYIELIDVPLEKWTHEARQYAIDDAVGTCDVTWAQHASFASILENSPAQARSAFSLHLMSAWGIKTNPDGIEAFRKVTEARFHELSNNLKRAGLVRIGGTKKLPKDVRNTKAAKSRMISVMKSLDEDPKLTDTGDISLDKEACENSGDDLLIEYAERTSLQTVVQSHIPALLKGVHKPIQARFNVLLETGRTSCSMGKKKKKTDPDPPTNGYQLQNVRRLPGIRECFESREGRLYIDNDFPGLELCTVAQVCIVVVGYSALADAINAGIDAHLDLGAQIIGISYEEAIERKRDKDVKEARQLAKPANFGFPGGLGPRGFVGFARGYGVKLDEAKGKELKDHWITRWYEFRDYFKWVRDQLGEAECGPIVQLYSNRVRGMCSFTQAANTMFQGLGADAAKAALYAVSRACYSQRESPLYHCRPVNFVHDQVISETNVLNDTRMWHGMALGGAHEAAMEQGRVMDEACNRYLPDVPLHSKPCLSKRWSKDAEAVFDAPPSDGGMLVPWDIARDIRARVFDWDGKEVVWKR